MYSLTDGSEVSTGEEVMNHVLSLICGDSDCENNIIIVIAGDDRSEAVKFINLMT